MNNCGPPQMRETAVDCYMLPEIVSFDITCTASMFIVVLTLLRGYERSQSV